MRREEGWILAVEFCDRETGEDCRAECATEEEQRKVAADAVAAGHRFVVFVDRNKTLRDIEEAAQAMQAQALTEQNRNIPAKAGQAPTGRNLEERR